MATTDRLSLTFSECVMHASAFGAVAFADAVSGVSRPLWPEGRRELVRLALATVAGPVLVLLAIVILVRVIADVVEE